MAASTGIESSDPVNSDLLISVVVPCYNEDAVLRQTHACLVAVLEQLAGWKYELVYVDDGSRDATLDILRELQAASGQVRVVCMSRNFGHQMATTAGLEHAAGDVVVMIDADLQDPPEVIGEMVALWRAGYQVVYGVRAERHGESFFKRSTARVFYRLHNQLSETKLPLDAGDFRLLDRQVVEVLLKMPERDRFLRGMISWVGFKQAAVMFVRAPRRAGVSKYPLFKMLRFAADGVISFSQTPLRLALWTGFLSLGVAFAALVYAIIIRLYTDNWVRGWASIFTAVLFMGGTQLVTLGIVGEYIGRIYAEVKRRPLYVVRARLGFEERRPRRQDEIDRDDAPHT
jgi:dolichol-phosphate mannosyltransferase